MISGYVMQLSTEYLRSILEFLNHAIGIGDILTIFAISISLFTLLHAMQKDRALRKKEQADKVRNAAAKTIAKLDRWRELSLSMFQDMEIAFVETSEEMFKNPEPQTIRDNLWKKLNIIRGKTLEKVLAEDIETAYVDLYGYDPYVRVFFENVLSSMKNEEEVMFKTGLLSRLQNEIGSYVDGNKTDKTAMLRNNLMGETNDIETKYRVRLNEVIKPVGDHLLSLISKTDEEILGEDRPSFRTSLMEIPPLDRSVYEKGTVYLWGEVRN